MQTLGNCPFMQIGKFQYVMRPQPVVQIGAFRYELKLPAVPESPPAVPRAQLLDDHMSGLAFGG